MDRIITFENLTFLIALGGIVFGIYHFFRNPNLENKENIVRLGASLGGFKELTKQIQKLEDNHIHTIETKVDELTKNIVSMRVEIGIMSSVIEERIPRPH